MLARALSLLCLAIVLVLSLVVILLGSQRPWLTTSVVILSLFSHVGVFAIEFALLYLVGRWTLEQKIAMIPVPQWNQVLRAWWGESIAFARVFAWWQPFRGNAQPDYLPERPTGHRGVVLIHGFVCNRGLWTPWFGLLRERGHAFMAVNLEPVFGSIDDYVLLIDDAVRRVTQTTGMPPVLVCHSMGGLAARAWLRAAHQSESEGTLVGQRVEQVITIGTPHHGTWLAKLNVLPFSVNAQQMQLDSPWLQMLQSDESARISGRPTEPGGSFFGRFICFYSHCDNIVFPMNTATLPGADNRHVPAAGHVALALDHRVISASLAAIESTE